MRTSQQQSSAVSTQVRKMLAVAAFAVAAATSVVTLAGTAAPIASGAHLGSHHLAINPQPLPPRGE
jgi:hypothetical protein